MKIPTFLLVICSLLQCFQLASSIECYQCLASDACKDPFDPSSSGVTKCNGTQITQCRKNVGEAASVTVVTRTCVQAGEFANECTKTSPPGGSLTDCYCSTDLCNTGHVGRQLSPVLMLGVCAGILFCFLLKQNV